MCAFRVGSWNPGDWKILLFTRQQNGMRQKRSYLQWSVVCVSWIFTIFTRIIKFIWYSVLAHCFLFFFVFVFAKFFGLRPNGTVVRTTHIVSSFNEFTCMMQTMHTHDSHNCQLKWDASDGKLYVLCFILRRVRVLEPNRRRLHSLCASMQQTMISSWC